VETPYFDTEWGKAACIRPFNVFFLYITENNLACTQDLSLLLVLLTANSRHDDE